MQSLLVVFKAIGLILVSVKILNPKLIGGVKQKLSLFRKVHVRINEVIKSCESS